VILKSYIVEQNIGLLKNYSATLMYGVNDGIKDSIKETIKKQNKDHEILSFFEEDILKKNYLYDNMVNESLFSEKKIIFIHEASDKIYDKVLECLEKENSNVEIYIFSINLEKKSKLRNLFERDKKLAIFACYEDNERTLITFINKELKEFKGVTGEIVNLLISNSNMDRKVIKGEITKIKDLFLEKKIDKNILELLNIKNSTSFDEIRDNALNGEREKINKLLSEVNLLNEDSFFYLNNINNRIMKLKEIIKISEDDKNKYEKVLENLKPPIFWKDKPAVIKQLGKWNPEKLNKMAIKISEVEILMKKNSYLHNDIVIKNLIVKLTNEASFISS